MKTSELRVKTRKELIADLVTTQKEQFGLRMQKNVGETNSAPRSHSFKQARRKIARIKTILNEKAREGHERKD